VRRPERGPLGGVCAGIAEHFGLDATLVRIGAVVLACLGPGIPAYLVAWIFIPEADGTTVAPRLGRAERDDRTTQALGLGLIIVALSVLWGDWWLFGRGWFLPLGLIALGAWLLLRNDHDDEDLPPGPPPAAVPPNAPAALALAPDAVHAPVTGPADGEDPPTTEADAVPADDTLVQEAAGGEPPDGGTGTATSALPVPPVPPPVPARPARRRVLGPLVFGALLVWGGIAWLAGVDAEGALAVGLCIVGVGFVVGAFVGGSAALIAPALLLAVALAVVSIVDIPFGAGIGDRTWNPTSTRELADEYELGIGEGTLDLSDLRLPAGRTTEVAVHIGIGHLEVIVPEGATVDVDAEVGAGEINVLGHREEGMGVDLERTFRGDDGRGRIELDLDLGLGEIEVREARS
jgi:phage shock protein PspC (stress-responsive transcriptional regulator)